MLKVTLSGLLAHKLRLTLAAIAVVLGVSFVSGTLVLSDTLRGAFDNLFGTIGQNIDVTVRSTSISGDPASQEDRPPMPASVLDTVRAVDGVRAADGMIRRMAAIVGKDGKPISNGGAPNLAFNWPEQPGLSPLRLRSGAAPHGSDEVVVDVGTAAKSGLRLGDTVEVVPPQGVPQKFRIVGLTGFGDQDNLLGATIVAFDTPTAMKVLGSPSEYDQISVGAVPGVSSETLSGRVRQALDPKGATYQVETGREQARQSSDSVGKFVTGISIFLYVFAGIALFVGSFIIINTFGILVAQRTRELALLRCLGASTGQVRRSVVLEALVVGVVASAAGTALGVLLAAGLEALFSAFGASISGTTLTFTVRTAVIGMAVGIVVTVLASLVPATRATRIPPVAAMRESVPSASAMTLARAGGGAGVLLLGIVALLVGLFAASSLLLTGLGALVIFVGVATLAPVVAPTVVGVLGAVLGRVAVWARVPHGIAVQNALRSPRRTASTASALMVGIGLVAAIAVVGASFKASFSGVLDRTSKADFIISPTSPGAATGMSPAVADALRNSGVAGVVSEIGMGNFVLHGDTMTFGSFDPATVDRVANIEVKKGGSLSQIGSGQIAISEDTAATEHLSVGDMVAMRFQRAGIPAQKVVTIYGRNALFGNWQVPLATARSAQSDQSDIVILVATAPGSSASAAAGRLNSVVAAFPGTQVQDNAAYKSDQNKQIDQAVAFIQVLLVLALVIALLGIVNTLALSIVERTREIGLLRAVGMSRRQVRSMIRWEAIHIGLLGALLGCVVGVCLGVALSRSLSSPLGIDTLGVPVGSLIVYVLVGFLAGVIAAILPARRASRMNVLGAIAME